MRKTVKLFTWHQVGNTNILDHEICGKELTSEVKVPTVVISKPSDNDISSLLKARKISGMFSTWGT